MLHYLIWTLVTLVLTYLIIKGYEQKNRFRKYGIPQPPEILFLGYMGANIFKRQHFNTVMKNLYHMFKDAKYVGIHSFFDPIVVVRDIDLVKTVLVKNFDNFANRKQIVKEVNDPLFAKNLAFVNGDQWKELRNLLSPAFTASKLRGMFVVMSKCAENFVDNFVRLHGHKEAIDMKDAFARYTNDVIATSAFGIEVDSIKEPDNEFYAHGRQSSLNDPVTFFKFMIINALPTLSDKLGLRIISKKVTDFFVNVIETTIRYRDEKGITRPDMLQLMMDARSKHQDLDLMEMTAQAFIFFLGGLETTSDNMCMIAYELAVNTDVQRRLQDEIDTMMKKCDNKPTYEAINELKYLDAVFMETMRRHPNAALGRICTKEFELPPAVPGAKPYLVKPGTEIFVTVAGLHDDPDLFEDPEKFVPDRYFEKKSMISESTNLGFGLGPRMCIGNRFAILETKVMFVYLLSKCNIVPCKKTCIPLEYNLTSVSPTVKGGCWLKLDRRD